MTSTQIAALTNAQISALTTTSYALTTEQLNTLVNKFNVPITNGNFALPVATASVSLIHQGFLTNNTTLISGWTISIGTALKSANFSMSSSSSTYYPISNSNLPSGYTGDYAQTLSIVSLQNNGVTGSLFQFVNLNAGECTISFYLSANKNTNAYNYTNVITVSLNGNYIILEQNFSTKNWIQYNYTTTIEVMGSYMLSIIVSNADITNNSFINIANVSVVTPALTTAQQSDLSISQMSAFTATQLAAFTATQLTAFSSAQLASLTVSQIPSITTLTAFTTQLTALSNLQISTITPTQFATLKTSQLSAFSTNQISAITATQIASLTATQISAFTNLSFLSPTQISFFTGTQIPSFTTTQISSLSTTQLPLSSYQLTVLTTLFNTPITNHNFLLNVYTASITQLLQGNVIANTALLPGWTLTIGTSLKPANVTISRTGSSYYPTSNSNLPNGYTGDYEQTLTIISLQNSGITGSFFQTLNLNAGNNTISFYAAAHKTLYNTTNVFSVSIGANNLAVGQTVSKLNWTLFTYTFVVPVIGRYVFKITVSNDDLTANSFISFANITVNTPLETSTQLSTLTTSQTSNIRLASFSTAQLQSLTVSQIPLLTSAQLTTLSTTQIQAFSSTQTASLTTSQRFALTSAQLAVLA
jgi:hypothetical protein